MSDRRVKWLLVLGVWLIIGLPGKFASAGPPFLTDDPVPVEYQHWEFYVFSTLDNTSDGTDVQAPAFELNYGVVPNVQAHLVFPFACSLPSDDSDTYGAGDMELGVKYRFVQETERMPQIGIFPMLEVPTGDEDRGLGNGKTWAKFPIWVQKSWGQWTTYGGGGYAVNGATGQRDYPFGGWLIQRDFGQLLTLGAELFAQGKSTDDGESSLLANFGGFYKFTEDFNLLFTVGHTIAGERHLIAYMGLYWTW
jgi:Putative MetA-pathway of phenol degradation